MRRFKVYATRTLVYEVVVEADNEDEAKDEATAQIENGEHMQINGALSEAVPTDCVKLDEEGNTITD